MVLVCRNLELGGIQTSYLRMARYRAKLDLLTTILVIERNYDVVLLAELNELSTVVFLDDLFSSCALVYRKMPLIARYRFSCLLSLFGSVQHVHVSDGIGLIIVLKMMNQLKNKIKITVGFYHHLEFCWKSNQLPYYEKAIRKIVFSQLPKANLFMFSNEIKNFVENNNNVCVHGASIFPIGVAENTDIVAKPASNSEFKIFKIVSVGRLAEFKLYNLWMIDLIAELISEGYIIQYDIYGDGPLKKQVINHISDLYLDKCVSLREQIPYKDFNRVVSDYDLFLGGGTALRQAAGIGVPSIVAIDSLALPITYGFITDCLDIDFTVYQEELQMKNVKDIIIDLIKMDSSQRDELIRNHLTLARSLTMELFHENFNKFGRPLEIGLDINYLLITISMKWNFYVMRHFIKDRVRNYVELI